MKQSEISSFSPSWQSSSYQRAIWRARRRISGKQSGAISEAESKVLRQMMGPLTKPDFSRWVKGELFDPGESWIVSRSPSQQKGLHRHGLERSSFHVIPTQKNDETSDSEEKTETEKARIRPSSSLPHEFIALSDPAHLHENETNRPIDISTAFDRFGLCNACFHKKGPHQHYQAPIRIGGGYSIYHQNQQIANEDLSWSTLKWLASPNEPHILSENADASSKQLTAGIGNGYSTDLYEQFLVKGGDAIALEEYLESNFNPDVLAELEDSGVNTILITEYAEMYRQHVKGLLQENIKRQSHLIKTTGEDVDFATLFSEIESAGTDMNMLMTLLTKGRNDEEILRFEEMGGNIEILEYYCGEIKATESYETIVDSFKRFLENDNRHQSAETFLQYVDSGGNLKMLKEFVKQRSSTNVTDNEVERQRIEHCVSTFPNETILLENLEWFSRRDVHLHFFARLLQQLIENGGSVMALKKFARTGFDSKFLMEITRGNAKEENLLQTIGEEFSKDTKLQQDLAEFPDEPYVTEAYIRRGGSFPGLVKAMSEALNAPKFEQYVKAKTTEALKKFSNVGETARNGNLSTNPTVTPRNSPIPTSSGVLSLYVLPRLLEKAKADLYFDKMVEAEQSWMKNEGQYILKALKQQTAEKPNYVSGVDISERNLVVSIFKHANSLTDGTSVSSITGKRRNKLWSAPKPFEIQRSRILPTRPRSPFTLNRKLRISSLTEDNILDIQKRQRNELDLMRRSLRVEDFQKNWHFAITSPRGSVVAANSMKPENLPITMHQIPVEPVEQPKKKDKVSRRKQHREKMRALKQESRSGKSSRQSSPNSERSSSSHTLQLPSMTLNSFPEVTPLPEITVTSQDAVGRASLPESRTESSNGDSDEMIESTTSSPQTRIDLVAESTLTETPRIETAIAETPVRYATAFGQKIASASFSNISSARDLKKLKDHPETMVEVVSTKSKITSKSESAIPSTAAKQQTSNLSWEELSGKMLAKKVAFGPSTSSRHMSEPESSSDEESNTQEIDILQRYCIVREDRVPLYKRIFEKYVLVKSIRDRENKLASKRAKSREHQNEENETPIDEFAKTGSAKFELGKTRFVLEKIKDNIEDIQMQIITIKGDVNRTVVSVARRKYADVIDAARERKEKLKLKRQKPVFGGKSPTLRQTTSTEQETGGFTDQEVMALLSPQMRLQCEAQMEVRDRKVTLVHLRDKVKRLKSRQRSLHALCDRLVKQIENEEVVKCMKRQEMTPFTRKQSAIFRELHPTDDPTIDECDLRQALIELDPALEFVDNSQILEGISIDEGITFRVFCVIAALHEKRNLHRFSRSLHEKMKACKDHYASLLGPNFDIVNLDLAAVGISGSQRQRIIQKLSRGGDGSLDILDFVTYVPLFVDIHEKIVANPLMLAS